MKRFNILLFSLLCLFVVSSCNSGSNSSETTQTPTADSGSVDGFKLAVQMWTFRMFPFAEAINKVDSAGIKYIEAFFGQTLGGDMKGEFGPDMDSSTRNKLKSLLQSKGISIIAMGVISPKDDAEWLKAFNLAKEFGLSYITTEPKKDQWNMIDSLSNAFGIKIAIHDHPRPSPYWSPDSVLAAIQGHKNIGACADIGHWARNGLDPVECLKKLNGHVYGVHFKDVIKFDDTKAADTVVGKGIIDLPAVFTELKKQNFNGAFSIEHESNWYNNLPDVIETRKYFEAQIEKLK